MNLKIVPIDGGIFGHPGATVYAIVSDSDPSSPVNGIYYVSEQDAQNAMDSGSYSSDSITTPDHGVWDFQSDPSKVPTHIKSGPYANKTEAWLDSAYKSGALSKDDYESAKKQYYNATDESLAIDEKMNAPAQYQYQQDSDGKWYVTDTQGNPVGTNSYKTEREAKTAVATGDITKPQDNSFQIKGWVQGVAPKNPGLSETSIYDSVKAGSMTLAEAFNTLALKNYLNKNPDPGSLALQQLQQAKLTAYNSTVPNYTVTATYQDGQFKEIAPKTQSASQPTNATSATQPTNAGMAYDTSSLGGLPVNDQSGDSIADFTINALAGTDNRPSAQNAQISINANSSKEQLQAYARQVATAYGIPQQAFLNLIGGESGWNPDAWNDRGNPNSAQGLGQFIGSTARAYGVTGEQLRADPALALRKAAELLHDNAVGVGGDWQKAFAQYFIGPGDGSIDWNSPDWISQANTYIDNINKQYGINQGDVSAFFKSHGLNDFSLDANAPVGPDGRTMAEITGTQYKSDAERQWYQDQLNSVANGTLTPSNVPFVGGLIDKIKDIENQAGNPSYASDIASGGLAGGNGLLPYAPPPTPEDLNLGKIQSLTDPTLIARYAGDTIAGQAAFAKQYPDIGTPTPKEYQKWLGGSSFNMNLSKPSEMAQNENVLNSTGRLYQDYTQGTHIDPVTGQEVSNATPYNKAISLQAGYTNKQGQDTSLPAGTVAFNPTQQAIYNAMPNVYSQVPNAWMQDPNSPTGKVAGYQGIPFSLTDPTLNARIAAAFNAQGPNEAGNPMGAGTGVFSAHEAKVAGDVTNAALQGGGGPGTAPADTVGTAAYMTDYNTGYGDGAAGRPATGQSAGYAAGYAAGVAAAQDSQKMAGPLNPNRQITQPQTGTAPIGGQISAPQITDPRMAGSNSGMQYFAAGGQMTTSRPTAMVDVQSGQPVGMMSEYGQPETATITPRGVPQVAGGMSASLPPLPPPTPQLPPAQLAATGVKKAEKTPDMQMMLANAVSQETAKMTAMGVSPLLAQEIVRGRVNNPKLRDKLIAGNTA